MEKFVARDFVFLEQKLILLILGGFIIILLQKNFSLM